MELKALEQFYFDHINEYRAEHEASGKAALDYLDHSTAKYHGKTIYSLYVPKLLNEKTVEVFRQTAETMAGIMRKVIVEYRENEAYRALFGFDKDVEQLIIHDPLYENVLPVCRVDIFYNEADGSFYFCELNTDGSSSMNEDRELCKAFEKTENVYHMNALPEVREKDKIIDIWLILAVLIMVILTILNTVG